MIIDDEDIAYGRQQQRKLDEEFVVVITPQDTTFDQLSIPVDAEDTKLIQGEIGRSRSDTD
jgi:hypothetical protein